MILLTFKGLSARTSNAVIRAARWSTVQAFKACRQGRSSGFAFIFRTLTCLIDCANCNTYLKTRKLSHKLSRIISAKFPSTGANIALIGQMPDEKINVVDKM